MGGHNFNFIFELRACLTFNALAEKLRLRVPAIHLTCLTMLSSKSLGTITDIVVDSIQTIPIVFTSMKKRKGWALGMAKIWRSSDYHTHVFVSSCIVDNIFFSFQDIANVPKVRGGLSDIKLADVF